jgi:Prp8 binding protein
MMPSIKRQASDSFSQPQALVKRQKSSSDLNSDKALTVAAKDQNGALIPSSLRTSALSAPILELTGHTGEIFTTRFSPNGQSIASGSMDRTIALWHTYGTSDNYGTLTGHKGAVLDLQWSRDSRTIYSASADMMIASWDLETGLRIRKHVGHEEVVNCVDLSKRGQDLLLSGSDDGTIGIWDPRQKSAVDYIETDFPITAVALAEQGHEIYSGGIDNDIKVWDARKMSVVYALSGHGDTITSLEVSPDGQSLLSNSHDSTVRTWDVRPFAPVDRSLRTYDGAPAGFEKNLIRASWSPRGDKICAGSGDRTVVVWDSRSAKLLYKLPGHKGTVNDVRFCPTEETIIVSASTDRNLMLGELGR